MSTRPTLPVDYAQRKLIRAVDYNAFATAIDYVNAVGSDDSGYGQTATISTVASMDKITAAQWKQFHNTMKLIADHQATTLDTTDYSSTSTTRPVAHEAVDDATTLTYDESDTKYPYTFPYTNPFDPSPWLTSQTRRTSIIDVMALLSTNINTIYTNRHNAAASGSTTSSSNTTTSSWTDKMVFTTTITFGSSDQARYFFNAGGQISMTYAHPSGMKMDGLVNDICTSAGTIWLSSATGAMIGGTTYDGVTKVGGATGGSSTVATNNGFTSLTSTLKTLFTQTGTFSITNYQYTTTQSFLRIDAKISAGVLTIVTTIDEMPSTLSVAAGTKCTVTLRPPSTTYLVDSWGTPTVSTSNAVT